MQKIPPDKNVIAYWKFDKVIDDKYILEQISRNETIVKGYIDILEGVKGNALRLDGYTTHFYLPKEIIPKSFQQFSITCWYANGARPWNNAPFLENYNEKQGFFLGVSPDNRILFKVIINGQEHLVYSKKPIPHFKWNYIAGIYDSNTGMNLYINGEISNALKFNSSQGSMIIPKNPVIIGRANKDVIPAGAVGTMNLATPIYLDGIIDELKIYDKTLSNDEIQKEFTHLKGYGDPYFEKRGLPTVPDKIKRFGAYYLKLKYTKEWDRLWRVGEYVDVAVKFDELDGKFVFWRGLNYIPAWVTENGIWYTNEFNETWPEDEPIGRCAEPMSDKQCRTSHVRIIESNDARTIIHWRYALIDVNYSHARVDELTGWGDWSDEYYVIYPDGVGVRDINLHSSQPMEPHEFQESIVILGEGSRPEDAYEMDAVTFFNLKGEFHTYNWSNGAPRLFMEPRNKNIHVINLKSKIVPFFIVSDGPCTVAGKFFNKKKRRNPSFMPYRSFPREFRENVSKWPWWAAWPALIPSDATVTRIPDRLSHSNVSSGAEWEDYEITPTTRRRIMLHGLWDKNKLSELPKLGKSWLYAPKIDKIKGNFKYEGYKAHEKAYYFKQSHPNTQETLYFTINASEEHPIINLAFVIRNFDKNIELIINSKPIPRGKDFRYSIEYGLEEDRAIIWIKYSTIKPCEITFKPTG
ncbi:MAG: LamG domain-containing protein [Promethearchaeota archaeon]